MDATLDTTGPAIRLTRRYPHPRDAVFRAWTDPEALKLWFAPTDAFIIPSVEVDLRVGGTYRMVMRKPDGTSFEGGGVYTEIAPPARLAFTWTWSFTAADSLVTVELHEVADGTEVVLTHERLASDQQTGHRDGWNGSLERLQRHLAGSK